MILAIIPSLGKRHAAGRRDWLLVACGSAPTGRARQTLAPVPARLWLTPQPQILNPLSTALKNATDPANLPHKVMKKLNFCWGNGRLSSASERLHDTTPSTPLSPKTPPLLGESRRSRKGHDSMGVAGQETKDNRVSERKQSLLRNLVTVANLQSKAGSLPALESLEYAILIPISPVSGRTKLGELLTAFPSCSRNAYHGTSIGCPRRY